jgi:MoaA/NifB/PqqE/SkfB family radical SAM enzyme
MLKELSIEILRKCPNRCIHCSSMSEESCDEMIGYGTFVPVVDDAARLGAKTICLSGGEPFLHPDVTAMISCVNQRGLNCHVYTSGIVFDSAMNRVAFNEDLLRPIAGIAGKLIFNLEAATEETYDAIMGTKGCFELLRESILLANSFSIVTEVHFVPMRLNIDEIEPMIVLCGKLGVSRISFLRLVLHGRAWENKESIELSGVEVQQLKRELNRLKECFKKDRTGIDIRIGVPLSNGPRHNCEAAKGKLNIKYDGNVFPCEVFKNDRAGICLNGYNPQNINNDSLVDIYNHSPYLGFVREQASGFSCAGNCESCVGQYMIRRFDEERSENNEQRQRIAEVLCIG